MKILSLIIALQFIIMPTVMAQSKQKVKSSLTLNDLSVKEIVLPSELQDLRKTSGSIYYNQSLKGKVLIPVHVWGQVSKPGLHFIPAETSFINALSMAGGPRDASKLDNVKLIRKYKESIKTREFDLTEGGNSEAYYYELRPNDTIFIERSTFFEDRAYYTTLVSVFVSLLSAFIVYNEVQKR
jgi:hypothetical protein